MRIPIGDRSVLCIDWDECSLRIVDASLSRAGIRIRRAVNVPMIPGTNIRDPASLGDSIRRTLGEHRIRTRRAIVDIPRQDAVLNLISLPKGSTDELAAMVHIQAAKDLPFSKDEAVIDFALTHEPEGEAKTCEVWMSAVRNMVLDNYKRAIVAAGLKLERIGLRPYAHQVATVSEEAPAGYTMIVDIGPAMTEIDILRDGRLVYSRAAAVSIPPEGLEDYSDGNQPVLKISGDDEGIPLADDHIGRPSPMETLLIEVSRTIQAYRSTDPTAQIDRIILAGTVGVDQTVVEAFEIRFNNVSTEIYEAPRSLRWPKAVQQSAAPFCSVVGLALSSTIEGAYRFDFLNPKEPEAQRRERVKRMPVIAATVALFVAAAGVTAYNPIRWRNAEIDLLTEQVKNSEKEIKLYEDLMDQLNDVRQWKGQSVAWIDPLKQLADIFPSNKEGYITKLAFNTDKGEMNVELVAVNKKVGTKIVNAISEIKDKKGDPVFLAAPGNWEPNKKNPKYPYKDKIYLKLKSLLSES